MNEPRKFSRQEIYEALWQTPITKLATAWNTHVHRIVQACEKMRIPRPPAGYWTLVRQGWKQDKPPLPPAETQAPFLTAFDAPKHRVLQRATEGGCEDETAVSPNIKAVKCVERVNANPLHRSVHVELRQKAEGQVLDLLREAAKVDFWEEHMEARVENATIHKWFKSELETVPHAKILELLLHTRQDYRTFKVDVQEHRSGRLWRMNFNFVLREGFEWKDVIEEAWSFSSNPNPHCLSTNAVRIWEWAKSSKNKGQPLKPDTIGRLAQLKHSYWHVDQHLDEIRSKADPTLNWERQDEGHGGGNSIRVWFEKSPVRYYNFGPLNPTQLKLDLANISHNEITRFRDWLYGEILKPNFPNGTELIGIYDIRSRCTLKACFSEWPSSRYEMPEFFDAVRLIPEMSLGWCFKEGVGPWLVQAWVNDNATWATVKERLKAKATEVPLEEKYGLSLEASALLKWIQELKPEEYFGPLTPVVEENLELAIGLDLDSEKENIAAYLEILLEEINDKTEYRLRSVDWRSGNEEQTRILPKKKSSGIDDVVKSIQLLGLSQNKLIPTEQVKRSIEALFKAVGEERKHL